MIELVSSWLPVHCPMGKQKINLLNMKSEYWQYDWVDKFSVLTHGNKNLNFKFYFQIEKVYNFICVQVFQTTFFAEIEIQGANFYQIKLRQFFNICNFGSPFNKSMAKRSAMNKMPKKRLIWPEANVTWLKVLNFNQ